MRKILHLTPSYWPHSGGVEVHIQSLNQELNRADFEIKVLTTQPHKDVPLRETHNHVDIYRLPVKDRDKKLATWLWLWRQRHHWLSADIIHIHDVVWWLYPFIFLVRKKTYATFHGWEGVFPIPLRHRLIRRLNSWLVTKRIHVGAWIEEFYGDHPDDVMYGGVTPVSGTVGIVPRDISHLHCVFVGRLEEVNGISLYLELCHQLQKCSSQVRITWVGDGSYRLACQAVGKVTGMVSNPDRFIREADIVLASSYLSILEAQVRGKVVIGLYSNRLKKAYLDTYPGKQTMIISPSSAVAFDQLQALAAQPKQWKKWQQQSYDWAVTQTWKKIANKYQKVWHFNE